MVMKRSNDKVTEPGMHQVVRGPDGDMVALHDERQDGRALLEPVMQHGLAADVPALDEVRRPGTGRDAAPGHPPP